MSYVSVLLRGHAAQQEEGRSGPAATPSKVAPTGSPRSDGRILNVLVLLAIVNGLVCILAPGWVVLRPGGSSATVGRVIYVSALAVLALTPLQLTFLWFVVAERLRDKRSSKRALVRLRQLLRTEAIDTAFQPIVNLSSGRVVGVEALARFRESPAVSPDVWFADAERLGCGLELELLAIRTALRNAEKLPVGLHVALNVSPATLASPLLLDQLLTSSIACERLVLEVTEHTSIPDYAPLQEARTHLRHHGIRLAVDDAGSGYASFRHIIALAPDVIKLDRALVLGIDHDEARQALVAAVVMYAARAGTLLVAEGIENSAELAAVEALGVHAAQGYSLGRPTTCLQDWLSWAPPTGTAPDQGSCLGEHSLPLPVTAAKRTGLQHLSSTTTGASRQSRSPLLGALTHERSGP